MRRQINLSWHILLINSSFSAAFAARFLMFTHLLHLPLALGYTGLSMILSFTIPSYIFSDNRLYIFRILMVFPARHLQLLLKTSLMIIPPNILGRYSKIREKVTTKSTLSLQLLLLSHELVLMFLRV